MMTLDNQAICQKLHLEFFNAAEISVEAEIMIDQKRRDKVDSYCLQFCVVATLPPYQSNL